MLNVLDHPLIAHKLSLMRDVACSTKDFRALLKEIGLLMGYELTRDLPVRQEKVTTPVAETMGRFIAGKRSQLYRSCAPVWAWPTVCWN